MPSVGPPNKQAKEDEDDQTAALLAGFESDRDESDLEKEDGTIAEDQLLDAVPNGLMKKLEKVSRKEEEPGVIYLGRIPHGFYESQLKQYFTQFGAVTRLRVSRNKKTGASKHYAFVEFASAEVADIVAKTMDKYLMFGRILQCKVIPPEQVHAKLFVGANQRFKRIPRNKMAGAEMARGAERAVWEKRVAKETERRDIKGKDLKEKLGYEYSAPTLKTVDEVPKKALALEDGAAQQLLRETPVEEAAGAVLTAESKPGQLIVTETVRVKKSKKSKKDTDQPVPESNIVAENVEAVTEQKPKKDKKRKANAVADEKQEEISTKNRDERVVKPKKSKKAAKASDTAETVPNEKERKVTAADKSDAKPKTKKAKA